jgi:hypothetical protein
MLNAAVRLGAALLVIALLPPVAAVAAPAPEFAKQCLRAAYMLYPYQRPGSAPMNGDRLSYFKTCMARPANTSADPAK